MVDRGVYRVFPTFLEGINALMDLSPEAANHLIYGRLDPRTAADPEAAAIANVSISMARYRPAGRHWAFRSLTILPGCVQVGVVGVEFSWKAKEGDHDEARESDPSLGRNHWTFLVHEWGHPAADSEQYAAFIIRGERAGWKRFGVFFPIEQQHYARLLQKE